MDSLSATLTSPVFWGYALAGLVGLLLMLYGFIAEAASRRRSILRRLKSREIYFGWLDGILDGIDWVVKMEDDLNRRISVLEVKHAARYYTKLRLLGALGGLMLGIAAKNALAAIPFAIIGASVPTSILEMQVKKRQEMFNAQILEAFQVFLSDYTTSKSINKTILNISGKLRYPLRHEFERLGRSLNSGIPVDQAFMEFAYRTNNKWTLVFAQMMITYFRNGGDFTEPLMNIVQAIADEKIADEENSTETSSLRTTNLIVNGCIPLAYLINRIMNPLDAKVYTDTPTGRTIIFVVAVLSGVSLYLGQKITDA